MSNLKSYEPNMAQPATNPTGIVDSPLAILTKPPVIFKFASALLSLIIYSCLLSAWYGGRCLFNRYNGICRFGSLSLVIFLIYSVLLTIEIFITRITSFKVKRRIAIADVIISGLSTLFYLILFIFLSLNWLKSDYPPFGQSINCCRLAILLSFLAIFALAASTGLAYVRYQTALDTSQFMTADQLVQEQSQYYSQNGEFQAQQYSEDMAAYCADPNQQYSSGNYTN